MQSIIRRNTSHIFTMIKRNLLHVIRNSEALGMTILLPVMVTMMFVYVFGGVLGASGDRMDYLSFVLPGMVIMTPSFGAYMTGIGVNNDMSKGIIDRFRTMDINQSSVLTGHVFSSFLRNIVGIALVILFSVLIGFRTSVGIENWLVFAGIVMLYVIMISMLSLLIGLIGNSVEAVGGIMIFVQFLPYLSSAFVPTETMPKVLRIFAENQPFTPIINTARGLMLGTDIGNQWITSIIWCVGIIGICFVLSKYIYTHKTSS